MAATSVQVPAEDTPPPRPRPASVPPQLELEVVGSHLRWAPGTELWVLYESSLTLSSLLCYCCGEHHDQELLREGRLTLAYRS